MFKTIICAVAVVGFGYAANYAWNSRSPVSKPVVLDYRGMVYAACHRGSFCESVIDVHFSKCYAPTLGNVRSDATSVAFSKFAECINNNSGYNLLGVSPNGELLSHSISH